MFGASLAGPAPCTTPATDPLTTHEQKGGADQAQTVIVAATLRQLNAVVVNTFSADEREPRAVILRRP